MHVDEIIKNYKPVYPASGLWEDTFKVMKENPHDSKIVGELLDYLEQHGEFREPIVLSTYEEYLKGEEGYNYDEGETPDPYIPHVENGTHRVCAHYFSAHKEAKVQFGWQTDDTDNESLYPVIGSRVIFPPNLDEKLEDDMYDRFRSYKLNDDIWINSDVISGAGNVCTAFWALGTAEVETLTPYIDEINAKVLSIVEDDMGITGCIVETAIITTEEEDDAFSCWTAANP